MAYTNVWDDTKPTGSEAANTIDDIFRSVKVDLEQRFIDLFNMANFTADPLRPGGLKFYDTADAKLFFGDNAGTPRGILLRNKADSLTYAQWLYTGITLSPPALTVSSTPFLNVIQTWNNVSTTFVGILVNITNTNSSVNSLFFDYQVGSVSQWKVSRAGVGTLVGVLTAGGFVGNLTGNVTGNLTGAVVGTTVSASTSLAIAATNKLYLDGVAATGDSYIWESSANNIIHVVGGVNNLTLTATTAVFGSIAVSGITSLVVGGAGSGFTTLSGSGAVSGFTTAAFSSTLTAGNGTDPVKIGGAGTYGMVTLNSLLNTTTGMGIFGRINGAEGVYYNTPTGTTHTFTVNGVTAATLTASTLTSSVATTAVQALTASGTVDLTTILSSSATISIGVSGHNPVAIISGTTGITSNRLSTVTGAYLTLDNSGTASGHKYQIVSSSTGDTWGNTKLVFFDVTSSIPLAIVSDSAGWTFGLPISATTGTFSSDLSVAATKKLFVDGGGDTYLIETSANVLDIFAGGSQIMRLAPTSFSFYGHTTVSQQTISGSRGGNAALASLLTALAATGIVVDGTSA